MPVEKHVALEALFTAQTFHAWQNAKRGRRNQLLHPPALRYASHALIAEGEGTGALASGVRRDFVNDSGIDFSIAATPGDWLIVGGEAALKGDLRKGPMAFLRGGETPAATTFADAANPFVATDVGRWIWIPCGVNAGIYKITAYVGAGQVTCARATFSVDAEILYVILDEPAGVGVFEVESVQSATTVRVPALTPFYFGSARTSFALVSPPFLSVGPCIFDIQGVTVELQSTESVPIPINLRSEKNALLYLVAELVDASEDSGIVLRIVDHEEDIQNGCILGYGLARGWFEEGLWIPAPSQGDNLDGRPGLLEALSSDTFFEEKNHLVHPARGALLTHGEGVFLPSAKRPLVAVAPGEQALGSFSMTPPLYGERQDAVMLSRRMGQVPRYKGNMASSFGDGVAAPDTSLLGGWPSIEEAAHASVRSNTEGNHLLLVNAHGVELQVGTDSLSGDLYFRARSLALGGAAYTWTNAKVDAGASEPNGYVDEKGFFCLAWKENIGGAEILYGARVAPLGQDFDHAPFVVSGVHPVDEFHLCSYGEHRIAWAWKDSGTGLVYWTAMRLLEDGTQTVLQAEEEASYAFGATDTFLFTADPLRQRVWFMLFSSGVALFRSKALGAWDTEEDFGLSTRDGAYDDATVQAVHASCVQGKPCFFISASLISDISTSRRILFHSHDPQSLWVDPGAALHLSTATICKGREHAGHALLLPIISAGNTLSLYALDLLSGHLLAVQYVAAEQVVYAQWASLPMRGDGTLSYVYNTGGGNQLARRGFSLPLSLHGATTLEGLSHENDIALAFLEVSAPLSPMPGLPGVLSGDVTPASGALDFSLAGALRDGLSSTYIEAAADLSIGCMGPHSITYGMLLLDNQPTDGWIAAPSTILQIWTSDDGSTWTQQTLLELVRRGGHTIAKIAAVAHKYIKARILASAAVPKRGGNFAQTQPWRIVGVRNLGLDVKNAYEAPCTLSPTANPVEWTVGDGTVSFGDAQGWKGLVQVARLCMRRMQGHGKTTSRRHSIHVLQGDYYANEPLMLGSFVTVVFSPGVRIHPVAADRGQSVLLVEGEQATLSFTQNSDMLPMHAPISMRGIKEGCKIEVTVAGVKKAYRILWMDPRASMVRLDRPFEDADGSYLATFFQTGAEIVGLSCLATKNASSGGRLFTVRYACDGKIARFSLEDQSTANGSQAMVLLDQCNKMHLEEGRLVSERHAYALHATDCTGLKFVDGDYQGRLHGGFFEDSAWEAMDRVKWTSLHATLADLSVQSPVETSPLGSIQLQPDKGNNALDMDHLGMAFEDMGKLHVRRDLLAGILQGGVYEYMIIYTLGEMIGYHPSGGVPLPGGWVDALVSTARIDTLLSS